MSQGCIYAYLEKKVITLHFCPFSRGQIRHFDENCTVKIVYIPTFEKDCLDLGHCNTHRSCNAGWPVLIDPIQLEGVF